MQTSMPELPTWMSYDAAMLHWHCDLELERVLSLLALTKKLVSNGNEGIGGNIWCITTSTVFIGWCDAANYAVTWKWTFCFLTLLLILGLTIWNKNVLKLLTLLAWRMRVLLMDITRLTNGFLLLLNTRLKLDMKLLPLQHWLKMKEAHLENSLSGLDAWNIDILLWNMGLQLDTNKSSKDCLKENFMGFLMVPLVFRSLPWLWRYSRFSKCRNFCFCFCPLRRWRTVCVA